MANPATPIRTVDGADHVLRTPLWIFIIRILQIVLSLVILALSAWFISGAYLDVMGLCIAAAVLTWLGVLYGILAERVPACRPGYHIVALLSLDAFFLVLWLAAFAATAAERAKYSFDDYDDYCLYCWKTKRSDLQPRGVVLYETGAAIMSATAGLGAWTWILFIVTFAWSLTMFVRGRKHGQFPMTIYTPVENHQMESQAPAQVPVQAEKPIDAQQQQQYQQQQPQQYPPQQQQAPYQPSPSPYQTTVSSHPVSPSPYDQQQQQQAVYPPPQELQGGQQGGQVPYLQDQSQPYYAQFPAQPSPAPAVDHNGQYVQGQASPPPQNH